MEILPPLILGMFGTWEEAQGTHCFGLDCRRPDDPLIKLTPDWIEVFMLTWDSLEKKKKATSV